MTNFQIFLLVYGIIAMIVLIVNWCQVYVEHRKEQTEWTWEDFMVLLAALTLGPIIYSVLLTIQICIWIYQGYKYVREIIKQGGWQNYCRNKKEKKEKEIERQRKKEAYNRGEIKRSELPKTFLNNNSFEIYDFDWVNSGPYMLYVENDYNKVFNEFFMSHDLDLFDEDILKTYFPRGLMLRWLYMPRIYEQLENTKVINYIAPSHQSFESLKKENATVNFLKRLLVYSEDLNHIKPGVFIINTWYSLGDYNQKLYDVKYHPLEEGTDHDILKQIKIIVDNYYYSRTHGLFKTVKNEEEGENYADQHFYQSLHNPEILNLLDEIKERIDKLYKCGLSSTFVMSLLKREQLLSKLVITKDYRIFLPDYDNKEIKLEPLNKAVYLLFLRHPEGILFKNLPDYKQELREIYQQLRPNGLNERALKSIEDVTNPCINSINEKCARIRAAFISEFDDDIAKNYYIDGIWAKPKKVSLPRELVEWEK